jgi:putative tryptophan/tyrosine transport system substrate-binding protein
VFAQVADPVGVGLVESLARPGGNITGFALFEYAIALKWLELLKEIAPRMTRVAVLRDPTQSGGTGQLGFSTLPRNWGWSFARGRDAREIERGITDFARESNGGLIVTAGRQALRGHNSQDLAKGFKKVTSGKFVRRGHGPSDRA